MSIRLQRLTIYMMLSWKMNTDNKFVNPTILFLSKITMKKLINNKILTKIWTTKKITLHGSIPLEIIIPHYFSLKGNKKIIWEIIMAGRLRIVYKEKIIIRAAWGWFLRLYPRKMWKRDWMVRRLIIIC
jgi:hypothetical protein